MTAQSADGWRYPSVNGCKSSVVWRCADILDYRDDKFTCSVRLLVDFRAFRFEYAQVVRIAGFVRRVLHFCNDHLAKREGAFERTNIHPGQMAISWNVSGR